MVMTHLENITYKQVGDLYGCRNWVEYGLKQSKNELGWADFREPTMPNLKSGGS